MPISRMEYPMAHLVLALLGPFQATLDGQPIDGLAYDKVRALLAYLRMHEDQPHQRDALATLLWPDQPTESARANLRKALATLRQALDDTDVQSPFLLVARGTIQFNLASDSSLDVATFSALLRAVTAHAHPEGAACAE